MTEIHQNSRANSIVTNIIIYLCGVIHFIHFIDKPTVFLTERCTRCKLESNQGEAVDVNHSLFVDDLKLYAASINNLKLLLDIVTKFYKDVGMTFGLAKCAYIYIERGKRKSLGKKIDINEIEISELEEGDMYKYLGIDEDIGFDRPLNKERKNKERLFTENEGDLGVRAIFTK